ncbi:MAG: DUF2953 domain-containing protein [Lachnospiraceae bacterium]|nr:DUF2953 domain-containing protein [Lachnospiraceae bacterium]
MAILLGILKIIGIVILCIILFVLALLLYLLLAPIRYRLSAENQQDSDLHFAAEIRDFIGFWHIIISNEKDMEFKIYALWGLLRVYPRKSEKEAGAEAKTNINSSASELKEKDESKICEASQACKDGHEFNQKKVVRDKDAGVKDKASQARGKTSQARDKASQTIGKASQTRNKAQGFVDQLKDERNQDAVKFLIAKALWLLKKIKPRIMEADVDFALGEPSSTGIATGIISICPVIYSNKVHIRPDFESEDIYLYGHFSLKGFVFLIDIVYLIISVLINKNCKRLFNL